MSDLVHRSSVLLLAGFSGYVVVNIGGILYNVRTYRKREEAALVMKGNNKDEEIKSAEISSSK
eukprot:CAMPEP_0185280670 /NCGR_PEP_ID=MMETSP1359-20130426/66272_1 /TAXON_ID=552665 /ORGANISM="Bigelowiella longifila, Strain CCMP242" /LENGTH=62 /DNA_ID=CAMNT_0027875977 /DNA_START=81 /DNA_END=269 /DNA_ORIENTATION=-